MIQEQISQIKATLPDHVRLVAVSKYHPIEALQEAYDGGQRIFGESKVQEMTQKHEALPKDIEWHFIGHLPHLSCTCSTESQYQTRVKLHGVFPSWRG